LGKYYSYTHSKPESDPFAVSFINGVGNTFWFTGADIRISRFQPRVNGIDWFDACAYEFTSGISKASAQTETVNTTHCSGAL
jgi:hypothetical protein